MTMRKQILALLIIAPLLLVALHAAGRQATAQKPPAGQGVPARPWRNWASTEFLMRWSSGASTVVVFASSM
jgi:hypothetical protein